MSTNDVTLMFLADEKLREIVQDSLASDPGYLIGSRLLPCPSCEVALLIEVTPAHVSYECMSCGFYGVMQR